MIFQLTDSKTNENLGLVQVTGYFERNGYNEDYAFSDVKKSWENFQQLESYKGDCIGYYVIYHNTNYSIQIEEVDTIII
jgi:hypothetical protein